jgi:hypothetical protein
MTDTANPNDDHVASRDQKSGRTYNAVQTLTLAMTERDRRSPVR